MAGEHVLIVEDDARICRMLSRYLKAQGYSVDYCYRGEDIDSRISQRKPDCVLLDLNLPDMHGYDVARRALESRMTCSVLSLLLEQGERSIESLALKLVQMTIFPNRLKNVRYLPD